MSATMIVQGVIDRPTKDPYGRLIPTTHAVVVPMTVTMVRAVRSGDLLEFERASDSILAALKIQPKEHFDLEKKSPASEIDLESDIVSDTSKKRK